MRSAFRNQRVQIGELNAQIEDSLLGERVVKAFSAEKAEQEKFNIGNKNLKALKRLPTRQWHFFLRQRIFLTVLCILW
ncbi:MAG: ABC transporter transmembrane domain-containing protein [Oscillospiraceae bacterium]